MSGSDRELPSVSLLLTSSVALTVFLMHNYPDTHSRRLFLPMKLPQLLDSNPISQQIIKLDYTHPSIRKPFVCSTISPELSGLGSAAA